MVNYTYQIIYTLGLFQLEVFKLMNDFCSCANFALNRKCNIAGLWIWLYRLFIYFFRKYTVHPEMSRLKRNITIEKQLTSNYLTNYFCQLLHKILKLLNFLIQFLYMW